MIHPALYFGFMWLWYTRYGGAAMAVAAQG